MIAVEWIGMGLGILAGIGILAVLGVGTAETNPCAVTALNQKLPSVG
jgi:hypothetical protein